MIVWTEKAWGCCRTIYIDDRVEIVEALIQKGGRSSIHKHTAKDNTFLVVSGELEVQLYPALRHPDSRILRPTTDPLGDSAFTVLPFVPHRFIALEETRLIEIYRAAPNQVLRADDIIRYPDPPPAAK